MELSGGDPTTMIRAQTQIPVFELDKELRPLVSHDTYMVILHVLVGVSFVVSVFGICTNAFNIITFLTMGVEDGVTTLLLGLAGSDLVFVTLTCISNICAILFILEINRTIWLTINPFAVAYFSENSSFIAQNMTALTSTYLAVARCMCVVKPLHFKDMFTKTRSLVGLALCFLFPFACQTAIFANMGMAKRFDASKNASRLEIWLSADREKVKDVVRLIFSFIVPLSTQVIVVVCVAVMIVKLGEAAQFRNRPVQKNDEKEPNATKLSGKERQVAIQVILICAIYMITNIPKLIVSIYMNVEPRFDAGKAFTNLYNICNIIRGIFEAINSSVNFFVYYTFSTSFRSACFLSKRKRS